MRQTLSAFAILAAGFLPSALPAAQIDDDAPINIELKAADLAETLRSFAEITGSRLVLDPVVEGKVTIDLEGVPWKEALGRICASQELSCELLHGEPPVLHVLPAANPGGPPLEPGMAQLLDLALEGADLRATLKSFGVITGREIVLDDAVSGRLTLFLQQVPWPILLAEVCDVAGCRVEWGGQAIRVLPDGDGPAAARRSDLRLDDASLRDALELVAGLPIFGPFGTPEVSLADELASRRIDADLESAGWPEILGSVCAAAGCEWSLRYGVPSRLDVVGARERPPDLFSPEPLATHPVAGTPGVGLRVRFEDPAGAWSEASARFTWAEPLFTLGVEGAASEARLAWIPFGPDLHLLLPILAECDGPYVRGLETLPLLRLPLGSPWSARRAAGLLELESPSSEGPEGFEEGRASGCLDRATKEIQAAFVRWDEGSREAAGERITATFLDRVGAYLLVTPPAAGPAPMAAVVALGADSRGRPRLAVVRPGADRRGEIDYLSLDAAGTARRFLRDSHGTAFALELRAIAR